MNDVYQSTYVDCYYWEGEKSNTHMNYKRAKEQSNSGGHYHRIIFFHFCSETNTDQANRLFCVIQSSTSNYVPIIDLSMLDTMGFLVLVL